MATGLLEGNERICLKGRNFRVSSFNFGALGEKEPIIFPGARANIYKLSELNGSDEAVAQFALRVMHRSNRKAEFLQNRSILSQLSRLEGFQACAQEDFVPGTDADDLKKYPFLKYASLIPWIPTTTWESIVEEGIPIDEQTSWDIAYEFALLVNVLERNQVAHCDLSNGNVLVNRKKRKVFLIDFDELYWPGVLAPESITTGTAGYARPGDVTWGRYGDRFAAAIMIGEMIAWRDASVRDNASGNSYFSEKDIVEENSKRYQRLQSCLSDIDQDLGCLFKRAWSTKDHSEIPTILEWLGTLESAQKWEFLPIDERRTAQVVLPEAAVREEDPKPAKEKRAIASRPAQAKKVERTTEAPSPAKSDGLSGEGAVAVILVVIFLIVMVVIILGFLAGST